MKDYIHKENCRLCGGSLFKLVMSLGNSSLANELVDEDLEQDTFPLDLFRCELCGHYQLLDVVSPDRMFKHYLYVSGTSKLMRDHFANYAETIVKDLRLKSDDLVCDIGSNDSTLLKAFAKNNVKVIGVEPAENLAAQSNKEGIRTISKFFSVDVAKEIVKDFGKASVVTSNNCFAHLDDMRGFVEGVKEMLADDGVFVFENAYLLDMLKTNDFSQVYHEHVGYFGLMPLKLFFRTLGMIIFDAQLIDIHGGSIRFFVAKDGSREIKPSVAKIIKDEEDSDVYNPSLDFTNKDFHCNNLITKVKLKERLLTLKGQGKTIAGAFASAKSTTLLHYFEIGKDILDCIFDDAPEKIGKLSSGKHIPILPFSALSEKSPDYVLILSYNFTDFVIKKHSDYKGTWIVLFPEI